MKISESRFARSLLVIAPSVVGVPYLLERMTSTTAGVLQAFLSLTLCATLVLTVAMRPARFAQAFHRLGPFLLIYFLLYAIAMARVHGSDNWSAASEARSYAAFAAAVLLALALGAFEGRSEKSLRDAGLALYDGLTLFVATNVVLAAFGLYTEKEEQMVMLGFFGIEGPRKIMMMSPGANSFGLVCGMLLAMSGPLLRGRRLTRAFVGAAVATAGLLLTDMRAGLLVGAAIAVFAGGVPRLTPLAIRVSVVVPVVVAVLIVTFNSDVSDQAFSVVRDEDSSGGRLMLWALAVSGWVESAARIAFGMGRMGQYESGYYYPKLFGAEGDAALIPVHNQYLQVGVDTGLLGIVILAIVLYSFGSRLRNFGAARTAALPAAAAVLYLEWICTTEVPLSPVHPFFLVVLLPIVVGMGSAKPPVPASRGVYPAPG